MRFRQVADGVVINAQTKPRFANGSQQGRSRFRPEILLAIDFPFGNVKGFCDSHGSSAAARIGAAKGIDQNAANWDIDELHIADDSSAATLIAEDVLLIADLYAHGRAVVDLACVEFQSDVTLDDGSDGLIDRRIFSQSTLFFSAASDVSVFDSDFRTAQVDAIRDSGETVDLSGNWWFTRSDTDLEQRILHEVDDDRRPLVIWSPVLNWNPEQPPGIFVSETGDGTEVDEPGSQDSITGSAWCPSDGIRRRQDASGTPGNDHARADSGNSRLDEIKKPAGIHRLAF